MILKNKATHFSASPCKFIHLKLSTGILFWSPEYGKDLNHKAGQYQYGGNGNAGSAVHGVFIKYFRVFVADTAW